MESDFVLLLAGKVNGYYQAEPEHGKLLTIVNVATAALTGSSEVLGEQQSTYKGQGNCAH